jgi:hypothetical protein
MFITICEKASKGTDFTQNLKMFQSHGSFCLLIESSVFTAVTSDPSSIHKSCKEIWYRLEGKDKRGEMGKEGILED